MTLQEEIKHCADISSALTREILQACEMLGMNQFIGTLAEQEKQARQNVTTILTATDPDFLSGCLEVEMRRCANLRKTAGQLQAFAAALLARPSQEIIN